MEKASGEVSPGHAKTDDDDEDDWEMTLNRYPGRGLPACLPRHSCLATIVLSLRDKSHSPIEAPRIKSALMG
jgi:hypothetical protein